MHYLDSWYAITGVDNILDLVYDNLDEALLNGNFEYVSEVLRDLDLERTPPSLPLSILTITLPWVKQLPGRADFYNRVRDWFLANDRPADALLEGLKDV